MNLIAGKYKVIQELGKGAFGQVLLVHHVELGTEFALKILEEKYSHNPRSLERFRREAQSMNALQHPGAVQVRDFGQTVQGQYYLAMEYCRGETLKDLILREGKLAPTRAWKIATQVLEVLAEAHSQGIIHRDLKPANIMIGEGGQVKVLDFGLARLDTASQITKTGSIVGTPMYMSPEQAQANKNIDHRSDIYAVGMILYHILAGQTPFPRQGQAMVIATKQIMEYPPPLSEVVPGEVPPSLEDIVFKAIHKDPTERFASAHEFLERGHESFEKATSSGKSSPPPLLAIAGAVGVVMILILAGVWLSRGETSPGEKKTPEKQADTSSSGGEEEIPLVEKKGPSSREKRWKSLLAQSRQALDKGELDRSKQLARRAMEIEISPEVTEVLEKIGRLELREKVRKQVYFTFKQHAFEKGHNLLDQHQKLFSPGELMAVRYALWTGMRWRRVRGVHLGSEVNYHVYGAVLRGIKNDLRFRSLLPLIENKSEKKWIDKYLPDHKKHIAQIRRVHPLAKKLFRRYGSTREHEKKIIETFKRSKQVWDLSLGRYIAKKPVVVGRYLLVWGEKWMAAINRIGGTKTWEHTSSEKILHLAPVPSENMILVAKTNGDVLALDIHTGLERWTYPLSSIQARLVTISKLKMAVAVGKKYVVAIDYRGRTRWQYSLPRPVSVSPVFFTSQEEEESLMLAHSPGKITALNPLSGKVRRTFSLAEISPFPLQKPLSIHYLQATNTSRLLVLAGKYVLQFDYSVDRKPKNPFFLVKSPHYLDHIPHLDPHSGPISGDYYLYYRGKGKRHLKKIDHGTYHFNWMPLYPVDEISDGVVTGRVTIFTLPSQKKIIVVHNYWSWKLAERRYKMSPTGVCIKDGILYMVSEEGIVRATRMGKWESK